MEIEEFEAEVKKILLRDPLAYRALMAYSALNYEDKIKFNNIMKYIHGKSTKYDKKAVRKGNNE